jgi:DNA-binding FrmR family transcriptional regulator
MSKSARFSFPKLILENHLRTHVAESMAAGNKQRQQASIEELLSLYELHNIRSK